jgi:hypothetical protein
LLALIILIIKLSGSKWKVTLPFVGFKRLIVNNTYKFQSKVNIYNTVLIFSILLIIPIVTIGILSKIILCFLLAIAIGLATYFLKVNNMIYEVYIEKNLVNIIYGKNKTFIKIEDIFSINKSISRRGSII